MKKALKLSNKGFSLVELMIVVAIIGVLASVAVPNFQRFMAKSKQSEAKSNLAAIFAAEKSFFAEWNTYFTDFRDIGYQPEGDLRYAVGFNAAGATSTPTNYPLAAGNGSVGPGPAANGVAINSTVFCALAAPFIGANLCTSSNYVGPINAVAVVTATTFIAGASGDIDGDATFDEWTIDEAKNVFNSIPDLND